MAGALDSTALVKVKSKESLIPFKFNHKHSCIEKTGQTWKALAGIVAERLITLPVESECPNKRLVTSVAFQPSSIVEGLKADIKCSVGESVICMSGRRITIFDVWRGEGSLKAGGTADELHMSSCLVVTNGWRNKGIEPYTPSRIRGKCGARSGRTNP